MNLKIMQGDEYEIPFMLQMLDGTLVTEELVESVVLNLGNLSRQYPGDVQYENGKWVFPVRQQQTFSMRGTVEPQARVRFKDGSIFGGSGKDIHIQTALNKGILGTPKKETQSNVEPAEDDGITGTIFVVVGAAGVSMAQGAVRYDEEQNLTPEQQTQARKNIGIENAGSGDMLQSVYDPDGAVEKAGGIAKYVEANGGKIDSISVNGTPQEIVDKNVDLKIPEELKPASESVLGGVLAVPKTDEMTERVGVDETGAIWYKPGESTVPTADEVLFTKDLVLTEKFGRYSPVNGKVTVPALDKSVQYVILDAFSQDKNPTITQPSIAISSSTAKAYEVGSVVIPAYNGYFNVGKYEYGPTPTGVTVTQWYATNNVTSEVCRMQNGGFNSYVVPDGSNYKITLRVMYSGGQVPLTALGAPYEAGKIAASSKTIQSGTITGYRNSFYGTRTQKDTPITSEVIRALTQKSGKALSNGAKFTVNVPIGAIQVIIAYPATLREVTSIKDVNGLNADITSAFSQQTVDVEGANSYTAISYRVYTLDFAKANDTANTYSVTI